MTEPTKSICGGAEGATPLRSHIKFYNENRDKILAYKKEFYANKSGKKTFDYLRNVQIIGMTKHESNKKIKDAYRKGRLGFQYVPLHGQFELSRSPTQWIADCRTLRTDVNGIQITTEDVTVQGDTWLILVFHPWMFQEN
jgi:hypothetical protein